mgnify:FL=1
MGQATTFTYKFWTNKPQLNSGHTLKKSWFGELDTDIKRKKFMNQVIESNRFSKLYRRFKQIWRSIKSHYQTASKRITNETGNQLIWINLDYWPSMKFQCPINQIQIYCRSKVRRINKYYDGHLICYHNLWWIPSSESWFQRNSKLSINLRIMYFSFFSLILSKSIFHTLSKPKP